MVLDTNFNYKNNINIFILVLRLWTFLKVFSQVNLVSIFGSHTYNLNLLKLLSI